jgi:two-component system response regulator FixJ
MSIGEAATVYLVDDDFAVRDSLRIMLESYGLAVQDYGSARAFLADTGRRGRGCLVLDLHMPEMSGLELLEVLREQRSALPVIVFTGRDDVDLKDQVERAGALALFAKPVDIEVLVQTIERALGSQSP